MNGDALTVLAIVGLVLFGIAVVLIPLALVGEAVRTVRRVRRGWISIRFDVGSGGTAFEAGDVSDETDTSELRDLLASSDIPARHEEADHDPGATPRERDPSVPEGWGFN